MTRTQDDYMTPVHPTAIAATFARWESKAPISKLHALVLFISLAALAILASSASAQAQKYDTLQVEKLIDDNREQIQRAATGYANARDVSSFPANQAAVVRRYFQQYVPAKITQPDSHHLINNVMNHATTTMERSIRSRTPGSANVMRWLYAGLKPVAVGNYHPSARINAINFIATLARPSAQRGGAPTPYPFVLTDMKGIYMDQSNSDAVRAAALKGIERFVRYTPTNKIPADEQQALKDAMNELLQSDAPAGRDELAHAFLQRYAINILTNLSTDGSLGKQLVGISTNETKPDLIALHSAAAIARLPKKMAEGDVETQKVLLQWSKRILKSYEEELARLQSLEKKQVAAQQPSAPESFLKETKDPKDVAPASRMMGGYDEMGMDSSYEEMEMESGYDEMDMEMEMDMGSGYGMGMSMMAVVKPQPAEVVASRQKLNYVFQQVLLGLTGEGRTAEDVESLNLSGGLIAATPADSIEKVKTWLGSALEVTTMLNDRTIGTRRDYVKSLGEQVEMLAALAEGRAVTPKATVDEDPFGFGNPMEAQPAAAAAAPPAAAEPSAEDALEAMMSN